MLTNIVLYFIFQLIKMKFHNTLQEDNRRRRRPPPSEYQRQRRIHNDNRSRRRSEDIIRDRNTRYVCNNI